MPEKKTILRDHEIRQALVQTLQGGRVVHEVAAGTARLDLGHIVDGSWVGYEIKSDVDTLKRLPLQVEEFDRYHQMVLVLTSKHRAAATALVPSWWGILVALPESGTGVVLNWHRRPVAAPTRGVLTTTADGKVVKVYSDARRTKLLWASLWAEERRQLLVTCGAEKRNWRKRTNETLAYKEALAASGPDKLRQAVLDAYCARDPLWAQGLGNGRMSAPLVAVVVPGKVYKVPDEKRAGVFRKRQDDLLACGHTLQTDCSLTPSFRVYTPKRRRCPGCRDQVPAGTVICG